MKKPNYVQLGSFLLGTLLLLNATPARAVLITQPSASYTSGTTLIPIVGPDGTIISSISGGGLTVNFSSSRQLGTVPTTLPTWGSPPNTESATPRVIAFDTNSPLPASLTLSFSRPLKIFGLEAQPDALAVENITATFFNGASVLATTTLGVNGNAGARLFAFDAGSGPFITSMQISLSPTDDFAIAQLRFAATTPGVPEPGSLMLLLVGLSLIGVPRFMRK